MAFTQQQVDKLEEAIGNGALIVKYADKEVKYRSLDEMIRILKLMKQSLGTIKPGNGRTYAAFSKGICPSGLEDDDQTYSDEPWIY